MTRLLSALLLSLLFVSAPAAAWGRLGHRLIAALAWDDLTPQARSVVAGLLAGEPEPTLPGIANWADDLREQDPDLGKRSSKWHYVNIAEDGCVYRQAPHCPNGGDCVVEAIRAQTAILADHRQPLEARRQALKFVVHFIGDVHQPLHAGYAHDKGGNDFQINMPDGSRDGRGSNLHSLWDSGMLNAIGLDEAAYLQRLRALPPAVPMARQALPPASTQWAQAACEIVVQPGFYPAKATIGDDYLLRWRPTAEAQLRKAGASLATTLNAALDR